MSLASSSKLLPFISGSGSSSRGNPGLVSKNTKQTIYQANFDATYEVDLFGSNTYAAKADTVGILSSEAELQNVMITLIAEVANQYLNLRYNQESLRSLNKIASNQKAVLDINKNSFQAGLIDETVVLQSNEAYLATLKQIHDVDVAVNAAYNTILTLLGKNPGDMKELLEEDAKLPSYNMKNILDSPAAVIARRPDVKIAEYKVYQTDLIAKSAFANIFPKISVSSFFGVQNSNALKSSSIWQVNANLLVPLLNWGQIDSQIKVTKSQNLQALYAYKQTVIEALADVESKIYENVKRQQNKDISRRALDSKRSILNLAELKYKSGLTSEVDKLNAEIEFYNQQLDYYNSQEAESVSAVSLCKALGISKQT
jgi:multidrug efflux system outer membrane protein